MEELREIAEDIRTVLDNLKRQADARQQSMQDGRYSTSRYARPRGPRSELAAEPKQEVSDGGNVPRLVPTDVDYDQSGGGVPGAIPELQGQLPVAAKLVRRMTGSDRDDYFLGVLERPIKYHPSAQFDWTRTQPKFIANDDDGQFVWIYAIIVCSLIAGTQVHAGMKAFPVRVAYVIDNTLGRDDGLNFHKCDYVAQGFINDLPDEQNSAAAHTWQPP
jgi:hypothetical protein